MWFLDRRRRERVGFEGSAGEVRIREERECKDKIEDRKESGVESRNNE